MNFLRVDKPEETKYDVWGYIVVLEDALVGFFLDNNLKFEMYASDVPHMVKALQAAYKEYKGE